MSKSHEEITRPKDYRELALERHIEREIELELELEGEETAYTNHLSELAGFFSNEAIPVIDNIKLANQILRVRNAPPVIEQTLMKSILEVTDIADDIDREKGNNFMPNLIFKNKPHKKSHLSSDTLQALIREEINAHDLEYEEQEEDLPEPVTAKELEEWHRGKLDFNKTGNLSTRTAFKRMYILFPEFTKDLIIKINSMPKSKWHDVEADAYVAYCIMSQLVDMNDAKDDNGDSIVDQDHLTV